jgi:hypothetical protein
VAQLLAQPLVFFSRLFADHAATLARVWRSVNRYTV